MGITKFNKGEFLFTDVEKYDHFKTLEDLSLEFGNNEKYIVKGLYTYKSAYGEGCFIKSDGFNISLPTHMLKTVKEIRNDEESVNQVNNGLVFIEIYTYTLPDKYPDKVFYSINFLA